MTDRVGVLCVVVAAAFAAAGCGSDEGGAGTPDAGGGPGADASSAPLVSHTYVLDSVAIALTAEEAEDLGFDLDGDGSVDNRLAALMSALTQAAAASLDLQGAVERAVDRGEILLLAELSATALPSATGATFSTYRGDNPTPEPCTDPGDPTTCRQHLDGNGSFEVSAATPEPTRVTGDLVAGTFTGGPGALLVQVTFGGAVIDLPLLVARAELVGVSTTSIAAGRIGGAVADEHVQGQVVPQIHAGVAASVARDCSGIGDACGCEAGSDGETLLGIFDADGDCTVTLLEVREDSLTETLVVPDVDTDGDGALDALSVGVGFTAVAGAFTPPE